MLSQILKYVASTRLSLCYVVILFLLSACGSAPKSSTEVFVIGTAHGKHMAGDYPLSIFYEIIKNNKTDLVLIEAPDSETKKNQWTHTTPEMTLIKYYAEQMQVPVKGIDALKLPDYPKEHMSDIKKTHEGLNKFIDKYSFDKLNNPKTTEHLKSLSNKIAFNNDRTVKRNKAMTKNIISEINRHKAQRVLIFTGYKHRYELEKNLAKKFKVSSPLNLSTTSVNTTHDNKAPQAVREQWKNTRAQLKQQMNATADSTAKKIIKKKLQLFSSFAKEE